LKDRPPDVPDASTAIAVHLLNAPTESKSPRAPQSQSGQLAMEAHSGVLEVLLHSLAESDVDGLPSGVSSGTLRGGRGRRGAEDCSSNNLPRDGEFGSGGGGRQYDRMGQAAAALAAGCRLTR